MREQFYSTTSSILRVYDSGKEKPTEILAALRTTYPLLTLATIQRVITDHRGKNRKNTSKAKTERPKTPVQQVNEQIRNICRNCSFPPSIADGNICVAPIGLCKLHAEIDALYAQLSELRKKEAEEKVKPKSVIKKTKSPLSASAHFVIYNHSDEFDDFERELDELDLLDDDSSTKLGTKGRPAAMWMPTMKSEYDDIDDALEDEVYLDDFADILADGILEGES